ncbi:MAG: hypothetical protein DWQ07_12775 [Chloroflexi bacterium]|nr:MAG: hypothetical protein DWQ07_12775 [Chloroflexota bacterium]MBL1196913.1 hypothetical protein [Chloroflexota bacterium]NOH14209.1 hypothetical protein [Chloroflexota bacterium]
MARTALPKLTLPSKFPDLPLAANAADFVFTAADVANMNYFQSSGNDLVLVQNINAGAQTYSIDSYPHPQVNRSGDIDTYSLGPGEFAMHRVGGDGWDQPGGLIHLDAAHADILFAIIPM